MGASSSRLEEDKGLQLCRARKKFIKQALNSRCSLAAAHIAYIEQLKILGVALRRFVELDPLLESFPHPSRSRSAEPSRTYTTENMSPSYNSHHMKFRTKFSKEVEEKPPTPVSVTITLQSTDAPEASVFETPPWDYFGLSNQVGNHSPSQERRRTDQSLEYSDGIEEKLSSPIIEESQESEDEFDEPPSAILVRRFKNINRKMENVVHLDSPRIAPQSIVPIIKLPSFENGKEAKEVIVNKDSAVASSESATSKIDFVNRKKDESPNLSQFRATSSRFVHLNDLNTPIKNEDTGMVAPKDISSSMKNIEQLFIKASESGTAVPRMLEAHKFHFPPAFPVKSSGSTASASLKSCFSCGDDPSEVQQEPPQNTLKYLTWHRTTSSPYASSQNFLHANSFEKADDLSTNLFDNFFMISGSHASTLDRLYAWEKKLYDEVKAGRELRSKFDQKCKLLRLQESRGLTTEKARSVVKNQHSRIQVSIYRIDFISKKIEEIRDKELQPQLEELIEGLARMWKTMLECHNLQLNLATISHPPGSTKPTIHSDSQRQSGTNLENELNSLSSSFTKWLGAQKIYVEAIDKWLFKCVSLPKNTFKRNRRMKPPPLRNCGPPIYMICGVWLEMINELPCKEVVDSIKDLAAEVAHVLPHQERRRVKSVNRSCNTSSTDGTEGDHGVDTSRGKASENRAAVLDGFHGSLVNFLGCLNSFAECSVKSFAELQKAIQEANNNYEQLMSKQKGGFA